MYLLCAGRVIASKGKQNASKERLSTNSSNVGPGTTSQKVSRWNSDVIVTYYYYFYCCCCCCCYYCYIIIISSSSNKCKALNGE